MANISVNVTDLGFIDSSDRLETYLLREIVVLL